MHTAVLLYLSMTAAIYYHPEAYTTSGPKLMCRNAAGESFLRGFLSHSTASEFWAQVPRPEHAQHFSKTVRSAGRQEPVKAALKIIVVRPNAIPSGATCWAIFEPFNNRTLSSV